MKLLLASDSTRTHWGLWWSRARPNSGDMIVIEVCPLALFRIPDPEDLLEPRYRRLMICILIVGSALSSNILNLLLLD